MQDDAGLVGVIADALVLAGAARPDIVARAALAAIEGAGFRVVPVEPDGASVARMMAHALKVNLGGDYNWHDYMSDLYRLGLSAAPKQG